MDGKDLRIVKLTALGLGLSVITSAQNLVPNPSFEQNLDCPNSNGQIELAIGWEGFNGSPDYYHECGTSGYGIPVNRQGGGYARTGQAYTVVPVWAKSIPNGRKYLSTELLASLESGVVYRAEFYISMADSIWYATKNIGIHFSTTPYTHNVNDFLLLTPQVRYADADFLDDKIRWTRISGSFTAEGGERYLAIGNFDSDIDTDTVFVPEGGNGVLQPESFWQVSAYFIDDVSVIPDSIYLSNEELSIKNEELVLYPHPASDVVNIEFTDSSTRSSVGMTVRVVDMLGRASSPPWKEGSGEVIEVNTSALPNGMYLITVTDHDGNSYTQRLVVQH